MFDKIDVQIVEILQERGKSTNLEMSEQVGLSVTACVNRIKKLEAAGVISGYHAKLDTSKVGLKICALVLIKVASNTTETAQKFQSAINKSKFITECYMTAGDIDYVAKIYARDFEHYEQLIREDLANLPGIVSMQSLFLFSNVVSRHSIPLIN